MEGTFPVTQDTLDQLQLELDNLKKVDRPRVIQDIAEARSHGDLKENAEYHAAKERQGQIEARIQYLEDRIARAVVVTHNTADAAHVTFGATVKVRNTATGIEAKYMLVSPEGMDPMKGKISYTSPIGKALIGKSRGETVEVNTPKGVTHLLVLDYQ
ncbi:MAG TPA: transcription elongation factor GreA [Fibrobacteraceae bacterium]|nr:transcription elongation factor GreA [Fibrobacteraceae bacterium]